MGKNRAERNQTRGRKRLPGKVVDNLQHRLDGLVTELGVKQEPCCDGIQESVKQEVLVAPMASLSTLAYVAYIVMLYVT